MASINDKITSAAPRWSGKIGSSGVPSASATTIPLDSVTNLTDGEVYYVTINRVDASGNKNSLADMEVVKGQLSGTNLINCVRGVEGTAQAWSAGTVVEILFTASQWNDLKSWAEAEHNQDGTHGAVTATSVTATGDVQGANVTATTAVKADTISEKTTGNGVVIDSIKLKDGNTITTTAADHITITPGSNKLVKIAVLRQDNTTNTYKNNQVILTGWGYIQGNGTTVMNEVVSFGITFSDVPIVISDYPGNTTSIPTSLADFGGSLGSTQGQILTAQNPSSTGFTISFKGADVGSGAGAYTSGYYYGYTWLAIGTL